MSIPNILFIQYCIATSNRLIQINNTTMRLETYNSSVIKCFSMLMATCKSQCHDSVLQA